MEEQGKPRVLKDLIGAMRSLLSVIDDSDRTDDALLAAWRRCSGLSDRCRAEAATVVGLEETERIEIREHLATAARLNAIAAHLVQRESERVGAELKRLREVRRSLRDQLDRAAEKGGSVDLDA